MINAILDVIAVCKSVSELQTFTSKSTNRDLKKKEVLLVDQSKTGVGIEVALLVCMCFYCFRFV